MPRISWSVLFVLLLFLASTLSSCNPKQEQMNAFKDTLEIYHRYIKHKEVDQAVVVVDPDLRIQFFKEVDKMSKSGDIVDFRIRTVVMNEDKDEAEVLLIRQMYDSSLVLREVEINQKWEKLEGGWMLVNDEF